MAALVNALLNAVATVVLGTPVVVGPADTKLPLVVALNVVALGVVGFALILEPIAAMVVPTTVVGLFLNVVAIVVSV